MTSPTATASSPAGPGGRPDVPALSAAVALVRGLVGDRDVTELLDQLVRDVVALLGVRSAGVVLADGTGSLQIGAASSEDHRSLELLQLQGAGGPCLTAYQTGRPVAVADVLEVAGRWPQWADRARAERVRSVYCSPLRPDGHVIGSLSVVSDDPDVLDGEARRVLDLFAALAALVVTAERRLDAGERLAGQLQHALNSRVVVEQAKGVVATALGTTVDDAFELIRRYCRRSNQRLHDVAARLASGELTADRLGAPGPRGAPSPRRR